MLESKKSVAKKAAPKVTTQKKAAEQKTATVKTGPRKQQKINVTAEERYRMIADAAYYKAERRGFVGGHPVNDWIEAEVEVDRLLGNL